MNPPDPFTLIDKARKEGIGTPAFRILTAVSEGETSQSRIAENMNSSRQAVNGTIRRLTKEGLLKKKRMKTNQRNIILSLTPKASELLDRIRNPQPEPAAQP